ncbi:MAG: LapA family protein [Thermodesulfobacteriota bacterium]|nr:LapA family protein [Thermodesulfobacteriota bacterium]
MKHLKFILAIILMLFAVILLVENHEAMSTKVIFKIDLLFLEFISSNISLYVIVTVAFLSGVLISGLYGILERFRLKRQIKALITTSRDKDKELNSLRNLPITSDVNSGQTNST